MFNVLTTSACPKHPTFLKVEVPSTAQHNEVQLKSSKMYQAAQMLTHVGGATVLGRLQASQTHQTCIFVNGAGNHRGCWHQLGLPLNT